MSLVDDVRVSPMLMDEMELGPELQGAVAETELQHAVPKPELQRAIAEERVVVTPVPIEEVIILLPALDEERGIGSVLDSIPFEELQDMRCEVAVLVVDGESEDATREIAARKGAHVFVQSGRGKGTGVRQAFGQIVRHQTDARRLHHRQTVIMLDADGTYPVEDIPLFVDALRAGNDVVMGSRLLGHIDSGAMTQLNRFGNRMLSLLAGVLFDMPVTDVCTGMWGFSEEFLQQCDLQAEGFELEAEIFASAALQGARITEVPIEYHVRHGTPKMVPLRTGVQIARCLLRKRVDALRMMISTTVARRARHEAVRNENLSFDS